MHEANGEEQALIVAIEGHARDWEEAIRLCGRALVERQCIGEPFTEACVMREKTDPTGLPSAIPVAIPHVASDEVHKTSVCVLKLKEPVVFHRMDSAEETVETRLIFNLAIKGREGHLEFLQKLIAFVMDEEKVGECIRLDMQSIPAYLEKNVV